ncbi:Unknown protein, partial [Striga hermonthica]
STPCIGQDDELAHRLKVFSLSDRENWTIDIARNDICLSDEECSRCLFGKVKGDIKASWIGIKRTMSQIWRLQQPVEVKELGHNYFQFLFQNREDLERVAMGANWIFENQYMILAEWQRGLSINHQVFQELNLWVQVFNISLNWLSTDVGLKIEKFFPAVKNVVVVGVGHHKGKILILLVSVDLAEPLPRCANVRLGDEAVTVSFKYEKLVNHCHYCGFIGHLDRSCAIRLQDIKNDSVKEGQCGDWMRASDGQFWTGSSNSESQTSPPQSDKPPSSNHNEHIHTTSSHHRLLEDRKKYTKQVLSLEVRKKLHLLPLITDSPQTFGSSSKSLQAQDQSPSTPAPHINHQTINATTLSMVVVEPVVPITEISQEMELEVPSTIISNQLLSDCNKAKTK